MSVKSRGRLGRRCRPVLAWLRSECGLMALKTSFPTAFQHSGYRDGGLGAVDCRKCPSDETPSTVTRDQPFSRETWGQSSSRCREGNEGLLLSVPGLPTGRLIFFVRCFALSCGRGRRETLGGGLGACEGLSPLAFFRREGDGRRAVLVHIIEDEEWQDDIKDLAVFSQRRNEPSRPFREFLEEPGA
jgi:hypothetical protein